MQKAIFKYFALVLGITLLLSSVVSTVILSDRMLENTKKNMTYAVKLVEYHLDYSQPLDQQVVELNDMAYEDNTRLTIIDKEGNVLADSEKQDIEENHFTRSEVKEALENGVGYATRYSTTLKKSLLYVAYYDNEHIVRLSIPYNGIFDNVFSLLDPLLFSTFFSLIVALFFAYKFSKTLNHPLSDMNNEIMKMKDNRTLHFDNYKYEEFNTIANKLKEQSGRIQETLSTLKQERKKINSILDQMNEGFVLLDSQDTVLMYNEKAKQLYPSFEYGKAVGQFIFDYQIIDQLRKVTREPKVADIKKDEEIYRCFISKVDYGVTLLFVNVTESVNGMKMRQEFFSNVSHELKTPITAIKGYSELLQTGMIDNQEIRKKSLDKILKEADHMSQLIDDILMISRLENKDIEVVNHPLTLKPIIDEITDSLQVEMDHKDIHYSENIENTTFYANHQFIYHLMNNLLTNAVKYNKEHGQIQVVSYSDKTDLIIEVSDTGKGIALVDQGRVFERFYRCDHGRDKETGGTGLGLSIVKHIVQYYQGYIDLKSELDKGTTFKIILPLMDS
ncbi:GHKL domain-containing protein [[Clostridium] spiroforme]|nr:GHKL domain-containing protein [Thomasclavelia spiroformis]MBM6879681.1 GHKL domain-containing protein [Thomasclavelia spiroformis]